ncbi:biopolymer transport protein ExbD [Lewinella aquimaris]|uniref:Biopolymer transport protein ExbD n=1 Tax=Neolewinella aquimaris TaxID=1835722 RepID=A0A840E628_9BACT|nr:biopolymer transporter ExbD [Neolewinella aquimaris]MBB4077568.1 biopolymer transport protein ExbD [Neolewinella aquimaris]
MALKKRSKVSAEFNMSSLTDIIFLLLIFFMLTSTVVAPNALNLKLPGRSDTPAAPATDRLDEVRIDATGGFFFNDRRISQSELEGRLQQQAGRGYSMLIAPDREAPVEGVVTVMDMAMRLDINGVLAAEEQ